MEKHFGSYPQNNDIRFWGLFWGNIFGRCLGVMFRTLRASGDSTTEFSICFSPMAPAWGSGVPDGLASSVILVVVVDRHNDEIRVKLRLMSPWGGESSQKDPEIKP